MLTYKTPKTPINFNCISCHFVCSKNSEYIRHLNTQKHINNENANNANEKTPSQKSFNCIICETTFKHISSLSRHKKKCLIENKKNNCKNKKKDTNENSILNESATNTNTNNNNTNNTTENILLDASSNEIKILTNLVLEIVKSNIEVVKSNNDLQKQNQELQKQVLDVCKNNNQPTTINSNNNNKTFNLQFFLNEQCKDAMNISDFVNSFQLKLEDLERVGQQGYVNGMSNIIIKKIKETDIYKRPFHCSDAKRETLYVKDINGWEREGTENAKMIKAVKDVGQKNFSILNDYRLLHPECLQAESEYNDKYVQMMIQAAGSQKENVNKVIKKISKEVIIEKNSE